MWLNRRDGSGGNPIPGYLLALLAGILALYATQQEEIQSTVILAWGICGTNKQNTKDEQQDQKAHGQP